MGPSYYMPYVRIKFVHAILRLVAQWLPLHLCLEIPPGLYYVVLKFMLGGIRTILTSRFEFKFEKRSPKLGYQEPP